MSDTIYLPFNCSVFLRPFLVGAEIRRGNVLWLLHNYQLPRGAGSSAELPLSFTPAWAEAAPSWRGCPYCGGYNSHHLGGTWLFWSCDICQARGNAGLNCAGCDGAGQWQCACGLIVTVFGAPAPSLVRGTVAGSAPQTTTIQTISRTTIWRS